MFSAGHPHGKFLKKSLKINRKQWLDNQYPGNWSPCVELRFLKKSSEKQNEENMAVKGKFSVLNFFLQDVHMEKC